MEEDKANKAALLPAQYRMGFYENEYPEIGELVMAEVKNSEENGCYVFLVEYDGKQGMIPLNEYSKIMAKAIHRVMKAGKKEILRVIRVDKEKGYIDLSKKQISKEDEKDGEQKYANATMIHSILIHVSEKTKVPIQSLYKSIVWPLYRKKTEIHPLLFLKSIILHEDRINELDIEDEAVKNELMSEIKRRFKTSILKTMAEFSVELKAYEGINGIKRILHAGVEASREKNYDVKISIIGAPKYTCYVETASKDTGREALMATIDAMRKTAAECQADFKIDREPKTVGDVNAHIQELIKQEELENQASSGEELDDENLE